MKTRYDAIVIGAGPAGLACSAEMAARGLEVALLDEQANRGGQIYRNISKASPKQHAILGEDYSAGMELISVFKEAPVEYFPQTRVWQAELLCSTSKDKTLKVWSTATQQELKSWTLPQHRQKKGSGGGQDSRERLWLTHAWLDSTTLVSTTHGGGLLRWRIDAPTPTSEPFSMPPPRRIAPA